MTDDNYKKIFDLSGGWMIIAFHISLFKVQCIKKNLIGIGDTCDMK